MDKPEKIGKLISDFAKDIVDNNLHGYGKKTIQEIVDEKIKEFVNVPDENIASVYTDEERKRVKEASRKVFKNHDKAFSKLAKSVDHPLHYGGDKTYEVIKVLEAWDLDFHLGNVLKYVCRAGLKNPQTEIEDLEKANWYLQRKIQLLKEKK